MKRVGEILAALAVQVATAQAQEAQPVAEPHLAAFWEVCVEARSTYESLRKAAGERGWTLASEVEHPEPLDFLREKVGDAPVRHLSIMTRRLVDDREHAFLGLAVVEVNGEPALFCQLSAFDAEPPTVEVIRNWMGRPADSERSRHARSLTQTWINPPSMPGVAFVTHMHVPIDADHTGTLLSLMTDPRAAVAPEGR